MNNYEKHLISHSKDDNIRLSSSSGGFCKSFLIYLIESKKTDYVILTRMKENSTEPESIITNDREKIISRTNSIYEYHDQIKILYNIDNSKKYAFIGLPCFVRYIRNQQIKNNKYLNIFPLISILCNQAPHSSFKYQLLKYNNIDIDEVAEIDYRYGYYPGRVVVKLKDNKLVDLGEFTKIWGDYHYPNLSHMPQCCLNCELFESSFADIVVGDPWKTDYDKDKVGWTKLIVRNEESMNLINQAKQDNYLHFENLVQNQLAYKHTKQYKRFNHKK